MKLNPNCIRDILLAVEEHTSFGKSMTYRANGPIYERLSNYTTEEVFYHIKQCELSNLLIGVSWCMDPSCHINDLSPLGHEFLCNIRSDTNWNKTKDIAKTIGSWSLDSLKQIAIGVISESINSQFR